VTSGSSRVAMTQLRFFYAVFWLLLNRIKIVWNSVLASPMSDSIYDRALLHFHELAHSWVVTMNFRLAAQPQESENALESRVIVPKIKLRDHIGATTFSYFPTHFSLWFGHPTGIAL